MCNKWRILSIDDAYRNPYFYMKIVCDESIKDHQAGL
jgi:hypothetical protein